MLILAVLCALAAGWCPGGRLSRFEGAGLRLLPLPVAALLLQRFFLRPWTLLLSYGLLLVFLVCNRHLKKTALFLGAGSLCNLTVIAANGWGLPVESLFSAPGSISAALLSGAIPMYAAADAHTRLLFLGDILYCPIPPFQGFASIGDILLALGVFFCLMAVMAPSRLPRWLKCG